MPSASSAEALAPAVSLRGITVVFGDLAALQDVSLDLEPGTRHAIVGENGAGKSTLMKVLFGLLSPTAGEVLVADQPRRFRSPADAIALGIGMVQQHFELIAPFTVAENVTLGSEVTTGPFLDRGAAEKAVSALSQASGLAIDPAARVETLSVAAQQRVEILKALYRKARLVILDEPTAVLAPSEARDLWAATERLAAEGRTVVFITHILDDVMAHADRVTVLRRGKRILTKPVAETNPDELAAAIIGTASGLLAPFPIPGSALTPCPSPASGRGGPVVGSADASRQPADDSVPGPPLPLAGEGQGVRAEPGMGKGASKPGAALSIRSLSVRGARGEAAVRDVSLELHPGEIVGLAGVDGSGQIELIEALIGLRAAQTGSVLLGEQKITRLPIAARRRAGMGYVPEDRLHRALVLPFSLEENLILGREREPEFAGVGGFLKMGVLKSFLKERAAAFDVRGAAAGKPARALSGGNQQKLVLARELARQPAVLIASQPTRGLDFAATAFVHDALRAERDRGAAVLVQSLDLGEVLTLSDRVAVMLGGKIVGIVLRANATEERIGALMTGAATA